MEKTESNETKQQDQPDLDGFIEDLKGLLEEQKEKNIIYHEKYSKKLSDILSKIPNKPVLVKELFPNFETETKEEEFLKYITEIGIVRPLYGGPWKVDSTIMFTKLGRDLARKHNIPFIPLVFVSYSHKDIEWKNLLESHLRVLDQYYHMETWDDEQIPTGKDFKHVIIKTLKLADAAILLISADFLSSDFIKNEEIPLVFEDKTKDVYPILLRPCAWNLVKWLCQIQTIHLAEGKALSEWSEGKTLSEFKPPAVEKCFATITNEIASRLKLIK